MTKVLLINPVTQKAGVPSIPPLGLAYLAAVLRDHSIAVKIVDDDLERHSTRCLQDIIRAYQPDIVGISALTLQIDNAYRLAQDIKRISKNIRVILGGAHPSALPEQTLREADGAVDSLVIGEGEMTFLDLAQGKSVNDIPGIARMEENRAILTPPRQLITDLDALPLPARDLLPIKKYRGWGPLRKTPTTHLISSRGCPFECIFCSEKSVFGKAYRARSAAKILDEIQHLVNVYGMREVAFYDDLFTLDKNRVLSICEEINRRNISVEWKALSRVNTVNDEMLQAMRRAGCWLISYGFESGSQEILNAIRKRQTLEQCLAAAEMTRRAGIRFYGFFMIGNVGETEETIFKTIRFARKLKPDYCQFTLVRPDPGSYLYNMHRAEIERFHVTWSEYYAFSNKKNTMPVIGTTLSLDVLLNMRELAYMCTQFKSLCVNLVKAILALNITLLKQWIRFYRDEMVKGGRHVG